MNLEKYMQKCNKKYHNQAKITEVIKTPYKTKTKTKIKMKTKGQVKIKISTMNMKESGYDAFKKNKISHF